MSWQRAKEPICHGTHDHVRLVVDPRPRNVGAFTVRRSLPSGRCRMVGPFIFFDEMGPAELGPGEGLGIAPHPHIGLATVTYLFEGSIVHRDSLGSEQVISPGAVNWMVAGRGVVHSERSPEADGETPRRLHGIQLWVALPDGREDIAPSFAHHPAETLPCWSEDGVTVRLMLGAAFDRASPVEVLSPMAYAEVRLEPGARFSVPRDYAECAIYLLSGAIDVAGTSYRDSRLLVLDQRELTVTASESCHLLVLAGEPVGERHIWWNFVSSSTERIERAKADWRAGAMGTVVGDEGAPVPLPE